MNPQDGKYNENEQLEKEEQAIGEQSFTPEESEQETQNKLMADADSREADLADGWEPEL